MHAYIYIYIWVLLEYIWLSLNSNIWGSGWWRYGTEREVLWRRVIEAKYGGCECCCFIFFLVGWWCTKGVSGPYTVSLCKSIRWEGWNFPGFFNLIWGMVLEWSFGMTSGVVIALLKWLPRFIWYQLCLIGMFASLAPSNIGSWNPWLTLWI